MNYICALSQAYFADISNSYAEPGYWLFGTSCQRADAAVSAE